MIHHLEIHDQIFKSAHFQIKQLCQSERNKMERGISS